MTSEPRHPAPRSAACPKCRDPMTRGCIITTRTDAPYRIDVCGRCHTTTRVPLFAGKRDDHEATHLKGRTP